MNTTKIDISIIIVNYNGRNFLKDCLESIYKSSPRLSYEVIVVDNCSQDGSGEMLKGNFPEVKVIENKVNVGFAKANNIAVKLSSGSYLLFLNPDTVILDNAIDRMIDYMSKYEKIGIMGPKVLDRYNGVQKSCYRFDSMKSLVSESILFSKLGITWFYQGFNYDCVKNVDVLSGVCLLVEKRVFEKVGLFDERFFMYCEDSDLCYRMKVCGFQNVYYPYARIKHFGGGCSDGVIKEMNIESYLSRNKLLDKYYKGWKKYILKQVFITGVFLRVLLFIFLKNTQSERKRLYKYGIILKYIFRKTII